MSKKIRGLQKFFSVVTAVIFLVNSFLTPLSIIAQEISPTAEPTAVVEQVQSPTPESTVEVTPTSEPITTPTITSTPTTIPEPTPTPTLSKWTFERVELNKEYVSPQNKDVKLTFTKLPNPSGNIKIEEITLTEDQVKQIGSLSDKAYDITSDMKDGDFSYNLSLPIPESSRGKTVEVKFTEEISNIGYAEKVENTLTKTDTSVSVTSLEHMTIFVVVNPAPSGALCVAAGATSETGCYATIQEAINAASAGDTINVAAGTYDVASTMILNKALTISGPTSGIAKVQGTNSSAVSIFEIASSNVTIQNLEITHNTLPTFVSSGWAELPNSLIRVPISLSLSGIVITNNKIYVPAQSGAMSTWNGVAITVGTGTTTGVNISNNEIHNTRNGVVIQYNNVATINNNSIYDTKGGIMNYTNNQTDANNRTVSNNSWGTTHNEWDIVWNTAYYIPDYQQSVLTLSGTNNSAYILDRRAADAAACTTLTGNRSHIFVDDDSSVTTAHPARGNFNEKFSTISLGINAVVPGGTVYVAAGTYNENIYLDKAVNLIGADKNTTTISNTGGAVITIDSVTTSMTISGFTIDANNTSSESGIVINPGSANITVRDNRIINFTDKGVLISNSDNNIVKNNTITGSSAGSLAGVYLDNGSESNEIDNNTITLATSGSGHLYDIWFTGLITGNNTVKNNTINGGSRAFQQDSSVTGTVTFSDNNIGNITGPSFAGVYLNGGSAVISGNTIKDSVRPIEFWGANNVTITNNTLNGTTYDFINIGSFTGALSPIKNNTFLNMGASKFNNRTGNNIDARENNWGFIYISKLKILLFTIVINLNQIMV